MPGELDPLIHQRTRLSILAALHRNGRASFTDLRDGLELTAGNLKSHADKLEDAGYIESYRALLDTRFETRYRITEDGVEAFQTYLDALGSLLEGHGVEPAEPADAEGRATKRDPGPAL